MTTQKSKFSRIKGYYKMYYWKYNIYKLNIICQPYIRGQQLLSVQLLKYNTSVRPTLKL